jgi:glycosyltransferase involved in cell wall biosynthesis
MTSVHRPLDVRIFQKQCRSLAEAGHQVVLIAVHDRDELRDGVMIRAINRPPQQWRRMTQTAWQVFRAAMRERADLYQIHDPELLPWAMLMRMLGKTVVYDMHENVPKDIAAKTWLAPALKTPVRWATQIAERILLWRLPVVFAENSYAADYRWLRRSTIVLNMPRLDLLPEPSHNKLPVFTLGYIGGVGLDRGSRVTLEALRLLKERGLCVGWECVGPIWPASHQAELEDDAVRYGLNQIRFHGYLPSSDGWQKMRPCHVGLAVFAPRLNIVDSYPTKLFEYMALELPVITSDFPLYRAIVDKHTCGICVNPDSPQELADAVERLVRDPQLAQQMGKRGRAAVLNDYNWSSEFDKLQAFYEQFI